MLSTNAILILLCYLPLISMTLITVYKNARYEPFNNQSTISNVSAIESQNICICRCFMNSTCATAMYNGYYRFCILYRAYLQEGQLQIMTSNTNSSVIGLRNMTSGLTTAALATTVATKAIETSTVTSLTATTAVATCTTLVSFDDISGPLNTWGIIPNRYKNLNWTNAQFINVSSISTPSGYTAGVRTQPYVLHNPTSINVTITTANGTGFSFDSLYLTSAWRDSLSVTMQTIRSGVVTSTGIYAAMTSYPTLISCSFCTNIDTITLQSGDGTPHVNYTQNGTQFVIDNLCISFGH